MTTGGRTGSVEARLADVRLAGDFADAGDALVRVNLHDENIERAVGESFDVRDTEVNWLDRGDFHGGLGSGCLRENEFVVPASAGENRANQRAVQ